MEILRKGAGISRSGLIHNSYKGYKNSRYFFLLKLISARKYSILLRNFLFCDSWGYISFNIENNMTVTLVTIKNQRLAKVLQRKLSCWIIFIEFCFRYHIYVNFPLIMADNCSDLFLKEFIFILLNFRPFTFSGLLELTREKLGRLSSKLWLSCKIPLHFIFWVLIILPWENCQKLAWVYTPFEIIFANTSSFLVY